MNTPNANDDGLSVRIDEVDLADGYEDEFFWTAEDGGMVFKVTNEGAKTSSNTKYARTELREMLRRGDDDINTSSPKNNWVFSTAPTADKRSAGAVDGVMRATLAVNAVTTTGSKSHMGRFIVGQIHAIDDEPLRLYYRKLPGNERGSIYAAHEVSENSDSDNAGDDVYYEIIGSRDSDAANPTSGPALGELWSYEVVVRGNNLTVIIYNGDLDGAELGRAEIDMSDSAYDIKGERMYFKAGAYNQNNTGDDDDFAQATFYVLDATHPDEIDAPVEVTEESTDPEPSNNEGENNEEQNANQNAGNQEQASSNPESAFDPTDPSSIAKRFGLNPSLPPGQNFDLLDWYLNTPEADPEDNLSLRIDEVDLNEGYEDEFFWTAEDGGMVFKVTNGGARTSKNTSYTRTELREMIRRGDTTIKTSSPKNNWVFSSAPSSTQREAGGVDGTMKATLAINAVTTTGTTSHMGRFIVGQIHAIDDEPLRLYYRKLPGNERGSIYAAHEVSEHSDSDNAGDDVYYEIIGSRSSSASSPENGPKLGDIWSYEVVVRGNDLTVIIYDGGLDGKELGRADIDMSDSAYDIKDERMYFKAGAYNQNNTGDDDDFAQATFYVLEVAHP